MWAVVVCLTGWLINSSVRPASASAAGGDAAVTTDIQVVFTSVNVAAPGRARRPSSIPLAAYHQLTDVYPGVSSG